VHCDFCHKVASVDAEAAPGVAGRLVLGRPLEEGGFISDFKPVMYGPYADVLNPFMGGAWSPVFATADFCRGCHEYEQEPLWDDPSTALDAERWPSGALPVHSTWSEWSASQFAGTLPCQGCHMPAIEAGNGADLDLLEGLEPGLSTGFPRAPGTVRSHAFIGPEGMTPSGDRLVDTAAIVTVETIVDQGAVTVTATITNGGAGHAFPTGEPMRSAVLVLDATCGGESLPPTSGDVVSAVGGALAVGVVGTDVTASAARIEWTEGAAAAASGGDLEVRAARPTGAWDDYDGVPPFDAAGLPPEARGRPILEPVGRTSVTSVDATGMDLDGALDLQSGDLLFLAHAVRRPEEGGPVLGLAGLAGRDFARVLVDAAGAIQAPHHRAMDVLRDDRIRPGTSREVSATFTQPDGCTDLNIAAVLVYRKFPVALARERGWDALEIVAATAFSTP
jgi:hypothetical protein